MYKGVGEEAGKGDEDSQLGEDAAVDGVSRGTLFEPALRWRGGVFVFATLSWAFLLVN